jgi:hypothetical protein
MMAIVAVAGVFAGALVRKALVRPRERYRRARYRDREETALAVTLACSWFFRRRSGQSKSHSQPTCVGFRLFISRHTQGPRDLSPCGEHFKVEMLH